MRKPVLGLMLAVALALSPLTAPVHAEPPPPDETAVLAELFTLGRSLDETRAQIGDAQTQVQAVTRRQADAAAERDRLEQQRRDRQAQFGRRLRFYQQYGRVAPVAVLLGASSFSDFISRLDALGRVLRYDSGLIAQLRVLNAAVVRQEVTLQTAAAELTQLQARLAARQQQLESAIGQREAILAGLREQRAAVEARLADLERTWTDVAEPVLTALGTSLNQVDPAGFTPDRISVSFLPPGATAVISSQNLNGFFGKEPALKGLTFNIKPGAVNLDGEFDGAAVSIGGQFVVADRTTLRYEPREIRIRDFTVPPESIAKLLAGSHIDIDVSAMLQPWRLKSVEMDEDELKIRAGY